MSSSVLKLCKACGSDISSPDTPAFTDRCPYCTANLKIATSEYFGSPDYLCLQKDSLLKELEIRKLKPGGTPYTEESAKIQNALVKWARGCPDMDKVAAMTDAAIILRELIHSEASPETMSAVVNIGKNLAALAKTIEDYRRQGGSIYDREIRLVSPEFRDSGGDQASATAGRDE